MKIFIVGGSGLVGGNCLSYFKETDCEVIATHRYNETEHTVFFDTNHLEDDRNFDVYAFNPDVIIHTGAQPNVELCEENEAESYSQNVVSARAVAELCRDIGAKMVFTSTDYVYDGQSGPYRENDEIHPLSVYGQHKADAEAIIQTALDDHLILRIGSVYGDEWRGKNFIIRIINDVRNGREWTMNLPQDQYSTPVNAYDVARVIHTLCDDDKRGIYHIGSTDYLNRVQLAERVLSYLEDHQCTVIPKPTSALGQKAARPLNGGLAATKFLSEYPDFVFTNVDDYMLMKSLEDVID